MKNINKAVSYHAIKFAFNNRTSTLLDLFPYVNDAKCKLTKALYNCKEIFEMSIFTWLFVATFSETNEKK